MSKKEDSDKDCYCYNHDHDSLSHGHQQAPSDVLCRPLPFVVRRQRQGNRQRRLQLWFHIDIVVVILLGFYSGDETFRCCVFGWIDTAVNGRRCTTTTTTTATILKKAERLGNPAFCWEWEYRIRPRRRICDNLFVAMRQKHVDDDEHTNKEPTLSLQLNGGLVVPRHVAFICDGNSRWAQTRQLPAVIGHKVGADRLIEILHTIQREYPTVQVCTMFAFSTENWSRPTTEIADLFAVMEQAAQQFHHHAIQEAVRVRILGDLNDDRIPMSLRAVLQQLEHATAQAGTDAMTLCLAINYGAKQDLLQAMRRIMQQAVVVASRDANRTTMADIFDDTTINEHVLADHLWTAGLPDPDLVIRTSGECRLSNFLLWNAAYAELYFVDTLWPDFDTNALHQAMVWYSQRQRRFGSRQSQQQPERLATYKPTRPSFRNRS